MNAKQFLPTWKKLVAYYGEERGQEVMMTYLESFSGLSPLVVEEVATLVMQRVDGYGRVPDIAKFQPYIQGVLGRHRAMTGRGIPEKFIEAMRDSKEIAHYQLHSPCPVEVMSWNRRFGAFILALIDKWSAGEGDMYSDSQEALEWFDDRKTIEERSECSPFWQFSAENYCKTFDEISPDLGKGLRVVLDLQPA